jgi:hypothetical protein
MSKSWEALLRTANPENKNTGSIQRHIRTRNMAAGHHRKRKTAGSDKLILNEKTKLIKKRSGRFFTVQRLMLKDIAARIPKERRMVAKEPK